MSVQTARTNAKTTTRRQRILARFAFVIGRSSQNGEKVRVDRDVRQNVRQRLMQNEYFVIPEFFYVHFTDSLIQGTLYTIFHFYVMPCLIDTSMAARRSVEGQVHSHMTAHSLPTGEWVVRLVGGCRCQASIHCTDRRGRTHVANGRGNNKNIFL